MEHWLKKPCKKAGSAAAKVPVFLREETRHQNAWKRKLTWRYRAAALNEQTLNRDLLTRFADSFLIITLPTEVFLHHFLNALLITTLHRQIPAGVSLHN